MPYYLNNGDLQVDEKLFGVTDRAWQFGDGIFESIRVSESKVLLMELHADRLARSAKMLGWLLPIFWSKDFWEEQILFLCQKNNWKNARIKIVVYRDCGGAYLPENDTISWIMHGEELPSKKFELNLEGLSTIEFSLLPKPSDILSIIKTTSALRYVQAARFALQNGVDDVLLTNQFGRFCEASSSNLFIVRENVLTTPPLSEYCLDGVMRSHILKLAKENGIEVDELPILKEDLIYADEVFICNAIKGIRWVSSFEENSYELGPITKTLFDLL